MKKLLFICFAFLAFSCSKESERIASDSGSTVDFNTSSKPPRDPANVNNLTPNTWTDAELIEMGTKIGCYLATNTGYTLSIPEPRRDRFGNILYNAAGDTLWTVVLTSPYTVYQNTVNNLDFPELYREGVREGFLSCFGRGQTVICGLVGTVPLNAVKIEGAVLFKKSDPCTWQLLSGK